MHYTVGYSKSFNERLGGKHMDFANRGGRPMQQQQPAPQMSSDNKEPAPQKSRKRGFSFGKISSEVLLFGVALLAVVMIVALVFGGKDQVGNKESKLINVDKYQAVFLNSQDGQVYFGKLGIYNNSLYVLTDIYYVRVENPIQPEGANQAAQPNISLAKLGNELHAPEDEMYISRDKVLYWENLKDDGQVVTAITEFKANGSKTPETQQQSNSTGDTQPIGTTQQSDTPADTTTP